MSTWQTNCHNYITIWHESSYNYLLELPEGMLIQKIRLPHESLEGFLKNYVGCVFEWEVYFVRGEWNVSAYFNEVRLFLNPGIMILFPLATWFSKA